MKIGENGIIAFKMYDLDMTAVKKIIFTFQGVEKVEKVYPSESVNYADNRFFIGLNQEDTLILSRNRRVKIQVEGQICFNNGSVIKTDIIDFLLNNTLNTNVIPGNAPSDFVNEIEFHYENGIIIIGGSGITEQRVREIISGYHFVTDSALTNYVTLSQLNTALNNYVAKNGLNDAIATYIDENLDLSAYATKLELNDYATKTEVNTAIATKQDTIQYFTMPTASVDYEDRVIQYVGSTTSTYTSGHFYRCVEATPSTSPKTYTWENAPVDGYEALTREEMLDILNGGGN